MAWIYRHLPAKRRLMLRTGVLRRVDLEDGRARGAPAGSLAERPLEPIDLAVGSKQGLGRKAL
jgi:hypothetical protein